MTATKSPPKANVRLDAEDLKLIAAIQKRTGLRTDSDVLRMGLRALARELGIKQ